MGRPFLNESQKNKMKQEKALVHLKCPSAVKHRPAVPFGAFKTGAVRGGLVLFCVTESRNSAL